MTGRILVTGVGGLIGSHVARTLRDRGSTVIGCDNFITGLQRNVPPEIEFSQTDCRDIDAMRRLCAGVEVVVHCAATPYEGLSVYSPHFIADQIFGASSAVFSAALSAGVRRIVFTSSMARYGAGPVPFVETQPTAPVDPYGVSKVATEMLLRTLCELHARELVICVPHNVVGPGQRYDDAYRNVAAIMINRTLSGDDIVVYGDGRQRRCFTHVGDVADQMCALTLAAEASGQVFNLGSDTGFITVEELAQRVMQRTGRQVRVRHLPARHGEVRDATCSHARIEAFMGRRSSRTLDDALDELIAEVQALGPRPLCPDLPLEIHGPLVPETWLPEVGYTPLPSSKRPGRSERGQLPVTDHTTSGHGVLAVFGTRPEAIKLAPVIAALRPKVDVKVCVTGQHREMLDQVLRVFDIRPDDDLDLMRADQDLFDITGTVLLRLREAMRRSRPALVMVQGDTSTTFAAALTSLYLGIDVAHVEAGLRTADHRRPFPEEANRRMTSALSAWHFAPTPAARRNLLAERVPEERIFVTGNTAIDALLHVIQRSGGGSLQAEIPEEIAQLCAGRRLILVTSHRRENFGDGFARICAALRRIIESHADVAIVYPLHLNPNVHGPVKRLLGGLPRLALTPPLDYVTFVALMQRAEIVLTDSGGIQEEAPSLGKPVLVMRDDTERHEGIEAGVAQLVGTDTEGIVGAVERLLGDRELYARMTGVSNPYGDGHAGERIADIIQRILQTDQRRTSD